MVAKKTLEPEVWKNETDGYVGILKLDRRGEEKHEMVPGQGKITLSTEERLLNQDKAYEKAQDMFSNGTLVPIRVYDGTEGIKEIADNPNAMSEDDLKKLFELKGEEFAAKLSEITNPVALRRVQAIAEEIDATLSQVKTIEARVETVAPRGYKLIQSHGKGMSAIRPVSPK